MKKRVLSISALPSGSTGTIMQGIAHEATQFDYEVRMFVSANAFSLYPDSQVLDIGSRFSNKMSIALNKLTGLEGCFAFFSTLKLLKKIAEFSPDVIHLHILHHGYVNLPLLFWFLKQKNIPIVWTFHDCWAFTGHCPHFAYQKCEKWKTGCYKCPRYMHYPRSLYDNSGFMWKWKKGWFSNLNNITIVTPSKWLYSFLDDSFMKNYPKRIVYNGVDLDVFKPTEGDLRKKYSLEGKKVVLGVASAWSERKGLDVFAELSGRLPNDYKIVLVGTNEHVEKELPESILCVSRTENRQALAQWYSTADVFVNPTREEVLGLVNLESLACGTPVVTFNVGGSPECLDETCGAVVECDDIESLERAIKRVCCDNTFTSENCVRRAQLFEMETLFKEYIELYDEMTLELKMKE